ncbi:MAG TPA: DNA gyrase inhibitor YacG [Anaeromyxobacteraceae bacterium]|nr:DNA gyrase inhibitor YacG [Anaeromyxobacteraceae bacterium]
MAGSPRCPLCARPVSSRPENRAWPFCSERCLLVDLGKWLGEEYRVPAERAGDADVRTAGGEDGAA